MSTPIRVPKGLYGVAVTETGIAKSETGGSLTYRGYSISDLFEHSCFEECAYLILNSRLPLRNELDDFISKMKTRAKVPEGIFSLIRDLGPEVHPMDALRTAASGLGAIERTLSPEDQKISIIAKMPSLVANSYRISREMTKIEPDSDLNSAANLLYMLTGSRPSDFEAWAFERELILYMEHDLNASAFAVRVIASTLADVYSACTGGIAALKGPLHGGANEAAMEMLLSISNPKEAASRIHDMLSKGQKIMGFGHRVYKTVDPRAQASKQLLNRLLKEKGKPSTMYDLCETIEKKIWEEKRLPANLDFYAAPIFYELGIPIQVYTPIFAASRIVGWVSHYNEQLSDNKLYRPDAIYVGASGKKYVQIDKR